jgi:hypothetical protein
MAATREEPIAALMLTPDTLPGYGRAVRFQLPIRCELGDTAHVQGTVPRVSELLNPS